MDFRVFGRFLIVVGFFIAACCLSYIALGLDHWRKDEEISLLQAFYGGEQTLQRRFEIDSIRSARDALGEKLVLVSAIGGVFAVLGVGILLSAKPHKSQ